MHTAQLLICIMGGGHIGPTLLNMHKCIGLKSRYIHRACSA